MNGKAQSAIRLAIGNELGIPVRIYRLQFGEDRGIALPGKDHHPAEPPEGGRLIVERRQLVGERYLADPRTDIVDGAEQLPQMGQRGDAGAPPGIAPPASGDRGKEQRRRGAEFFRRCGENMDARPVSGQRQT